MSTLKRYYKYDKGRFHKPESRKKKAQESKILAEEKERARVNINKWIDQLPNYHDQQHEHEHERFDCTDHGGSFMEKDTTQGLIRPSRQLPVVEEELEEDNTLDKGFNCENGGVSFISSINCEVSINNLLPQRLRERCKSEIIKGDKSWDYNISNKEVQDNYHLEALKVGSKDRESVSCCQSINTSASTKLIDTEEQSECCELQT